MRSALKTFDWHIYGLSIEDFDYTVDIVNRIIRLRGQAVDRELSDLEQDPTDAAKEILSDVKYYTWIEDQYFWHFCLWRLQGILEGLITTVFLESGAASNLFGLKAKLDAMIAAGYTIPSEVYAELLEWSKLRNALSHCPPEQFRPVALDDEDIKEYLGVVKPLVSGWQADRVCRSGK
jgi:hypothetical protein